MFPRKYLKEIIYLLGVDKKRIPALLILFIGVSLLDIAGIGIIGPYIALVLDPTALEGTLGKIVDTLGLPHEQLHLLTILGIMLVVIFLIKTVVAVLVHRTIIRFSLDKMADLCSQLMASYQAMPYSEYIQRNSSEYIYNIQTLTSQYISQVLQPLLYIMSNGILVLAIMALLAWQDLSALILLATLLGTVVLGYDKLFKNKIREYGKEANIASTTLVQGVHEGIEGLKEIRILNKEDYFFQMVDNGVKKYSKYNTYSQVTAATPRYILELIMVIFVVLLVISTIHGSGNLQAMFPTMAMFGVAALRLLPSANTLSSSLISLRYNRDAVTRLYNDLKYHQQKIINHQSSSKTHSSTRIQHEPFAKLELKYISFRYSKESSKAINQIFITINSGDSIGLIGSSGSGKTTLVDLILGLLEPQEGTIYYNGKPIEQAWKEWRSQVAYLPQEVFLIDNTLRNNIALGVNESEIDEEKIDIVIKQARLIELVNQLPQGKETFLGERGVRLSGGQRQRIALARAFYHGREVLVMDEATSALDSETEREIVEEIERLKGKKTMIVIAHRLTTLQHCDRIYELKDGKIIESVSRNCIGSA
jgi:ATP-binding cassette, subfamily B, bacterial PglK